MIEAVCDEAAEYHPPAKEVEVTIHGASFYPGGVNRDDLPPPNRSMSYHQVRGRYLRRDRCRRSSTRLSSSASFSPSPSSIQPRVVGSLLNLNTKVILGYTGTRDVNRAKQRGEVDGTCGLYMSSISSQYKTDVTDGNLTVWILLFGTHRGGVEMQWSDQRRRFRRILADRRCVFPATVFDALSARMAEDLGFEVGMLFGSVASLAVLGSPNLVILTLTELAEQAYRICRAGKLPLLVDADHGYGNALNVKRTVEELETAGVAALTIEDTLLPIPFGETKARSLIPVAEGVGKIRAAVAGRQDPDLAIVARSSAVGLLGLDQAIVRFKAYEAAGADALFLGSCNTRDQLDALSSAVEAPLLLGNFWPDHSDPEYLAARRVRVCHRGGHLPIMAAIRAVHDTLKALHEGKPPSEITNVASGELLRQTTREEDYETWIRKFLGTETT